MGVEFPTKNASNRCPMFIYLLTTISDISIGKFLSAILQADHHILRFLVFRKVEMHWLHKGKGSLDDSILDHDVSAMMKKIANCRSLHGNCRKIRKILLLIVGRPKEQSLLY